MQSKLFPRCLLTCWLWLPLLVFVSPVQAEQLVTVLVAYHSVSGHTEKMAQAVAEGVQSVPGTRVRVERVEKVTAEVLFSADTKTRSVCVSPMSSKLCPRELD